MATGFYDSNGIWNYGEDDNIALFSDTLNKLADSTSDAFTSDRSRLSTLEAGSLSGLIPVKPTSVTIAGGTASVNTLGVVTFTNATALSLNGVFTSLYSNYRFVLKVNSSVSCAAQFRFRAAGTDNSSATVTMAGIGIYANNTQTYYNTQNDSRGYLGNFNGQGTTIAEIIDPNQTTVDRYVHYQTFGVDGGTYTNYRAAFKHSAAIAFDGFTITPSAGNISGYIQVFGYND